MVGDFRFFWPENIGFFARIPSAWDSSLNTGIGIPAINTLWITSYLNFTASFSHFGLSWNFISLIFWIIPFLTTAFLSSFLLFRFITGRNNLFAIIAGIIYTSNTYFLLVFLGGQVGVCFAYAFIPLITLIFIKLLRNLNLHYSLLFALVFSLELLFDPRFAFLTLIILGIYYFLRFRFSLKEIFYVAIIPGITIFLLHSFWLLPLILFKSNVIPYGINSEGSVSFFSFAEFENSISLLHPNWPENLFGKVYFMKPEFLLLPILAYSSLFFLSAKRKAQSAKLQFKNKNIYNNLTIEQFNNEIVLFFVLLGLIGAFLAKGANEPFGNIFLFLFDYVPGFSLFRDPTKFYSLIALSYSVLIPFSLWKISEKVSSIKYQALSRNLIFISLLLFWLFSLRLLFATDIFKIKHVPESYTQLKDFIVSQNQFFRTLWIPSWQRYGYFSDINPAIGRGELFKQASASAMINELKEKGKEAEFQNLGIKYVIIPEDSEGEIFLDDRRYSERIYKKTISEIEKIKGMKKIRNFGKIVVFEIPNPHDRFWISSSDKNAKVSYKMINSTKYLVSVKNINKGDIIVFSESFDPNWIAESSKFSAHGEAGKLQSSKFGNYLNSFVLPEEGSYSFFVLYQQQKMVNIGLIISGITLIAIIFYFLRNLYKKRV